MKQLFTFILFTFAAFNMFAQDIVTDPSTFEATISEDEKKEYKMTVTNSGSDNLDVYWKVVKSDDWPAEWTTIVCDANLCYSPNFDECPSSKPNGMDSGASSTAWSIKVDPHGVKGTAKLHMEFYSDSDFTNLVGSTEVEAMITADSDLISSTSDNFIAENIVVYPNPTYGTFRIKNDNNIDRVTMVNIVGKEIWSESHQEGKQYDISALYKGMYIVRLYNVEGQLVRSIRVNKSSL